MRYLLDTNAYIRMISDRELLTTDVRAIVEDYDNQLYLSTESTKEMIVLYRTRRLLTNKFKTERDLVESVLSDYAVTLDLVDAYVLRQMADLRINEVEGHHDPSDHIIIAQAIAHRLVLISSDTKFPFYRQQGLDLVEDWDNFWAHLGM